MKNEAMAKREIARRRGGPDGARGRRAAASGFTLIEILMVVVIIAILLGILIPTLSYARKQAMNTDTTVELAALSNACDAYYQIFQFYPGPKTEANLAASFASGSLYSRMSGAQNLAIGLLGTLYNPSPPPAPAPAGAYILLPIDLLAPIGSATYADYTPSAGTTDLGTGKKYNSFYSPRAGDMSYVYDNGNTSDLLVQVLFDRYRADSMPILYFRKNPGIATVESKNSTTPGVASYYRQCNSEYLDSPNLGLGSWNGSAVVSAGSKLSQSGSLYNSSLGATADTNLTAALTNSATSTAQGGYVLISAGLDHVFGNSATGKNDDIVVFGGQ